MDLLTSLKTYFNIADTSKDGVLTIIIANTAALIAALNIDESLQFAMCVEDFSNYLKTGNTNFKTSQATQGISVYSDSLRDLITRSMKVGVYP